MPQLGTMLDYDLCPFISKQLNTKRTSAKHGTLVPPWTLCQTMPGGTLKILLLQPLEQDTEICSSLEDILKAAPPPNPHLDLLRCPLSFKLSWGFPKCHSTSSRFPVLHTASDGLRHRWLERAFAILLCVRRHAKNQGKPPS